MLTTTRPAVAITVTLQPCAWRRRFHDHNTKFSKAGIPRDQFSS